jgi:hypothetical protein
MPFGRDLKDRLALWAFGSTSMSPECTLRNSGTLCVVKKNLIKPIFLHYLNQLSSLGHKLTAPDNFTMRYDLKKLDSPLSTCATLHLVATTKSGWMMSMSRESGLTEGLANDSG